MPKSNMQNVKNFIKYAQLFCVTVMALWFMYSGMMKLVGYPGMEESFMVWGYSKTFMLAIGIYEIVLAVLLFAQPTRNIGYVGSILLTTGALYTHISNIEYEEIGAASWILALSALFLVYNVLKLEDKLV